MSAPNAVTPYLCVSNATDAIAWYEKALGAQSLYVMPTDTGKVMHARLLIQGAMVMLSDDFPEWNEGQSRTPEAYGGSPVSLHVEVPNVDEVYAQCVESGAAGVMPPENMFWGARYAKVIDPFGHVWDLQTTTDTAMTPEKLDAAAQEFMQS